MQTPKDQPKTDLGKWLRGERNFPRPSSRWTAVVWLGLTGLLIAGSHLSYFESVAQAYWQGKAAAASSAVVPGATSPGTSGVATGQPGQSQTTIGGSPIVPGSPDTGSGQLPNIGNSFPTSVGLPNVPSGAPAVGGPLPSGPPLGQWRYGRIGPGELVG